MKIESAVHDYYEISPRFRNLIVERIVRLEHDADRDELQIGALRHPEHIRRQMRLVAVERAEALRMRLFLDHSRARNEN